MPNSIIVADAPPEVQAWVDAVIQLGLEDGPDWPLPTHSEPQPIVISLGELWRAIDETFRNDGTPWSIARMGLPPIELADGTTRGRTSTADLSEVTGPNSGSYFHNLWHRFFS